MAGPCLYLISIPIFRFSFVIRFEGVRGAGSRPLKFGCGGGGVMTQGKHRLRLRPDARLKGPSTAILVTVTNSYRACLRPSRLLGYLNWSVYLGSHANCISCFSDRRRLSSEISKTKRHIHLRSGRFTRRLHQASLSRVLDSKHLSVGTHNKMNICTLDLEANQQRKQALVGIG